MGLFAKYLQDCGIVPQYIMLETFEQNGVTKRHNHTLKDMMCKSNLPEY